MGTESNKFEIMVIYTYTQATSKCRIQLGLETPLDEALVENNNHSGEYTSALSIKLHPCSVIVKINNDV